MATERNEYGEYVAPLTEDEFTLIKGRLYGKGNADIDRLVESIDYAYTSIREKDRLISRLQSELQRRRGSTLHEGDVGVPENLIEAAVEVLWLGSEYELAQQLQLILNQAHGQGLTEAA